MKQTNKPQWQTRKTYKPSTAMKQALERTKELYPDSEKSFVTIGSVGNNHFPDKRS